MTPILAEHWPNWLEFWNLICLDSFCLSVTVTKTQDADGHPTSALIYQKKSGLLLVGRSRQQLTRVGFQHAARVTEVLGVLDDGNLCHPDDHCVGPHLGGRRGVVAIGDVMKGTGGVIVITDNRGRAWGAVKEKRRGGEKGEKGFHTFRNCDHISKEQVEKRWRVEA